MTKREKRKSTSLSSMVREHPYYTQVRMNIRDGRIGSQILRSPDELTSALFDESLRRSILSITQQCIDVDELLIEMSNPTPTTNITDEFIEHVVAHLETKRKRRSTYFRDIWRYSWNPEYRYLMEVNPFYKRLGDLAVCLMGDAYDDLPPYPEYRQVVLRWYPFGYGKIYVTLILDSTPFFLDEHLDKLATTLQDLDMMGYMVTSWNYDKYASATSAVVNVELRQVSDSPIPNGTIDEWIEKLSNWLGG